MFDLTDFGESSLPNKLNSNLDFSSLSALGTVKINGDLNFISKDSNSYSFSAYYWRYLGYCYWC